MATVLAFIFYIQFFPVRDVVEEEYATYGEVIQKDVFAHGMVPDFLPKSATAIRSRRNLDLNETVVEFSYGDDFSLFLSKQKVVQFPHDVEVARPRGSTIDVSSGTPLLHIACTVTLDDDSRGTLVINNAQKRAVFMASKRNGCNGK